MSVFEDLLLKYSYDKIAVDCQGHYYWLHGNDLTFKMIHFVTDEITKEIFSSATDELLPLANNNFRFFYVNCDGGIKKYGCVTKDDIVFGRAVFDEVGPCTDDWMRVRENGKTFYINKAGGKFPVPNVENVRMVQDHIKYYEKNGLCGLCTTEGEDIIPAILDLSVFEIIDKSFTDNHIVVRFKTNYDNYEANEMAYLLLEGAKESKIVLSPVYSNILVFDNGTSIAQRYIFDINDEVSKIENIKYDEVLNIIEQWNVDCGYHNCLSSVDEILRDNPPEDAFDGDLDAYLAWRDY